MAGSAVESCSSCSHTIAREAVICPSCDEVHRPLPESVLKLSSEHSENTVTQHTLVPIHEVISGTEISEVTDDYNIDVTDLPKINHDDPPLEGMNVQKGDVVRIERDSRTTDTAISYRLVTPLDEESNPWRWSASLPNELYEPTETIDIERGQHIIGNLRGAQPPAQPGSCLPIAVAREELAEQAVDRIRNAEPFTYISGELGFGKSFFLRWIRDEILPWAATSIIDLSDDVNFNDFATIVTEFRSSLQTPKSIGGDPTNGVDVLWGQFLAGVTRQIESDLEDRGFELTAKRTGTAAVEGVRSYLNKYDFDEDILDKFVEIAAKHYRENPDKPSLTMEFSNSQITNSNAIDFLRLVTAISEFNGYPIFFGVDELEKSYRTSNHFDNILEFTEALPSNISMFVTGTPELLEGGGGETSISGNQAQLYEVCKENLLQLEEPTEDDLKDFLEAVISVEEAVLEEGGELGEWTYTDQTEELDGVEAAVEEFMESGSGETRGFRGLLRFLSA